MPIGSTNVYNPGDLILSTVSGSGTSFIETKIIAATSSFILFNSSGTLTSASLNSIVATTSSYVSGSTSIITNLTASNISASGTGSFGIVGIGTTLPNAKLEIIHDSTATTPALYIKGGYVGTTIARFERIYGVTPTTTYVDINGSGGNAQLSIASAANTFALGVNTTTSAFEISDSGNIGTNTRLLIDVNGNVGIGTTSPGRTLEVSLSATGAAGGYLRLRNPNTTTNTETGVEFFNTTSNVVSDAAAAIRAIRQSASNTSDLTISTTDSSNLTEKLRITSTGNVGIGTTTPGALLEISSSTAASLLNVKGAGGNGILFVSGSGNVGIGTSSPVGKLHVVGGGGSGALVIQGNGITSHFHYGTNEDTYIRPGKTVGAVFIADVGGNVGIGTTTTTAKLHVSGSTGGVFEVDTAGGVTSFYVSASGNIGIGTSTSILGKLQLDSGVAPYYGPTTSSATPNGMFTLGSVLGDVVNTFGVDASATAYAWIQPRKITVASYSNLVLNPNGGNVGIGTTLPASKFHISGSGQTIMRLDSDTTSSVSQFQIKAASDAVLIMGMLGGSAASTNFGVTAAGQAYFGTSTLGSPHPTSLVIGNVSNIPIAFSTNNVERMRIDSGGAVGIGTTTVSRTLHAYITTGPVMRLQSSGSNASIEFIPSIGHNKYNWLIGAQQNISDAFEITPSTATNGTTFSTPAVLVASSGNVGIGTTSPTQRLDLSGSLRIRSAGTYSDPADNAGFINYDSTGGIFTLSARSNGGNTYMAFRTSNAGTAGEKMRIINDGNVGIGTSSPAVNLEVVGASETLGTIRISGGKVNVLAEGEINSALEFAQRDASVAGLVSGKIASISEFSNGAYAGLGFYTAQQSRVPELKEAVRIKYDGNVGIGTTVPAYLLDVSGSSRHGYRAADTHQFTGSVSVSGSLNATASWANNVVSASYALSSSFTTRAQTANALNALNTYSIAGLTSAYVDVDGAGTIPTTGIYRPSTKTLGLSADGTLIFKISNVSSPATSSIETGNFVIQSGNVGIGTTSPTAQLHICLDTSTYPTKNVARIVNLGYSGITGAQNWTLRGAYQYGGGIALNADGGDLDLIKSLDRNTILATKTDGTQLGNVGIGTTNPTARLHVSGSTIITGSLNVSANITCLSLTETSTEAVKYNILPLPSQLDNVIKLKPVSFNYKANDKHSIGLIAEEVAKIYPEFTSDNNDSISYGKITSVLIQSIKELKTIIDNQQKQIENLIDKLK